MIKKIISNGIDEISFLKELEKRNAETDKKITQVVTEIIENVRENGDEAVKQYTLKFDGITYRWNNWKKRCLLKFGGTFGFSGFGIVFIV